MGGSIFISIFIDLYFVPIYIYYFIISLLIKWFYPIFGIISSVTRQKGITAKT